MKIKYIFSSLILSAMVLTMCSCNANDNSAVIESTAGSQAENNATSDMDILPDDDDENGILPDGDDNNGILPDGDDDNGILPDGDDDNGILPDGDDNNGILPDGENNQTNPSTNDTTPISEKKTKFLSYTPIIELSREKLDILSSVSNAKVQYGAGKERGSDKRPTGATSMQAQYGEKGGIFIGENTEPKKIYLTFDEGYEAGYTPQILKTLAEKNVKATFFITGGYLKYSEDMVRQIVDAGHSLGNHTQNHLSMPDCSVDEMASEINELHNAIRDKVGIEMSVLRPPMGEFSEQSLELASSLGYKSIFWSFAYADWDKNDQPDPEKSLKDLKARTHNGAIILLHAVSSTNAKILGDAIDYWIANGYELATW